MKNRHITAASVSVALSLFSSCETRRFWQNPEKNSSESLGFYNNKWDVSNFPLKLCYYSAGDATEKEAISVAKSIATAYNDVAEYNPNDPGVAVKWGGECQGLNNEVALSFDNTVWPQVDFIGKGSKATIHLFLTPSANLVKQGFVSCETKSCAPVIAVHEFGHTLGLLHEQNRATVNKKIVLSQYCQSKVQKGDENGTEVGEYDESSIMNSCNPIWNNAGKLSKGDIQALQVMYGKYAAVMPDKLAIDPSCQQGYRQKFKVRSSLTASQISVFTDDQLLRGENTSPTVLSQFPSSDGVYCKTAATKDGWVRLALPLAGGVCPAEGPKMGFGFVHKLVLACL